MKSEKVRYHLTRWDKDVRKIMRGEILVAFLLRLSSGNWGIYDTYDRPLTRRVFTHQNDALEFYQSRLVDKDTRHEG